jgi:ribonuclease HII
MDMLELTWEKQLFAAGYKLVGGIDEAGRGPLAGPVVAACVICPRDFKIGEELFLVNDSKQLSEKKREMLYEKIFKNFPAVGIGVCDNKTIDKINILEAAFLAMKKAIGALRSKPDCLLLDGRLPIPNISLPQKPVIHGDALVFSIAAASIIAKVTRDRLMKAMDERYPEYGFKLHKGYGTKFHFEQIKKYGPCPIHRRSFSPIKEMVGR